MGIGIVLLFWAVAGAILASVGALVFGSLTAFLTRGSRSRSPAIVLSSAFPFVCLGWAGGLFIFQAIVNEGVLHRDPGLGDTWNCPLPNGYAITMIDVTDQGWVYNPKTQPGGGVGEQEDAVAGVRTLQVAGKYIFGAADSHASDFGKPTDVDSFFLLDTSTGKRTRFANQENLSRAALQVGVHLNLEDIQTVYSRYRFTWFDVLVGLALLLPLAAYFFFLARWIVKIRRAQTAALSAG
jgi:energy-coupling factor transporter transmembrane protein EcfT